MTEWKEYKLNELGKVGRGKSKHRPRNEPTLFGGVYPFIQTGDIKEAVFYITKHSQTYSEKGLAQSKIWKKGTLCITIAANIADTAILGIDACFPDSVIGFIANEKKSDVRFIKYSFDLIQKHLQSISQGTTQDNLSQTKLLKFNFKVPELSEQKRIASILSAYDELIENDTKRISILQQSAEQIYKEWFVRMRFPGYENAEFEKGVPKGWEVVELKQIAKEVSKGTKSGMHLENRFYLPMELLGQKQFNPESYFSFQEANSSLVTFEKGDFLFGAMRPYLHKVCIAPFNGITRTTSFVIRPKDESFYSYLFLLLFQKSTVEFASIICNGSDRPYVVWNKSFEKMKVFKPSKELVEKFEETVRPMLTFISNAFFTIEKLKQTRDLLLPRLISGKLRVKEIKEAQLSTAE